MENNPTLKTPQQVENKPLADQELSSQPAQNNRLLLIFLAFLSLVAISLAGFFGYQYYQNKQVIKSLSSASPIPSPLVSSPLPSTSPILDETNLPDSTPEPTVIKSNKPDGWMSHNFPTQNLTVYTPPQWQSSLENFSNIPSTLIRFWEAGEPENSTIQLNITNSWDNIGIGTNYTYFNVSDSIQAYRIDPPKMDEKKLDRYQTNFHFENEGKVYSLLCVHNWMEINIKTCETLLKTLEFSN